MTRLGRNSTVHFWEEPLFEAGANPHLAVEATAEGVNIITPMLPLGLSGEGIAENQRSLLEQYIEQAGIGEFVAWYYTPMALAFSVHLHPLATVYDCMDELSAFQGAPPELLDHELALFSKANVVFAGGASLYEAKRLQHSNVRLFPSSIDFDHFAVARQDLEDPADQRRFAHPRVGFYGVLDERLDCELLRDVALLCPEWHFILLGPVVKIRHEHLPQGDNLHYLGQKTYEELPTYLSHWDVAMLPFARNASTRFISPTKTPEYLAAGRPVVSTPIRDVVAPYGNLGLARIAGTAEEFADAIGHALSDGNDARLDRVDRFLEGNSWDKTFAEMWEEIQRCIPPVSQRVPHEVTDGIVKEHADV